MKSRVGKRLWLGVALALCILLGWRLGDAGYSPFVRAPAAKATHVSPSGQPGAMGAASKLEKKPFQPIGALGPPGENRGTPGNMIAQFDLTGDPSTLIKAQQAFPNGLEVILASCLTASTPDSEWLAKLQQRQPYNGLPHLIRAELYAEKQNANAMAEELKMALAKNSFVTGAPQRLENMTKLVFSGESSPPKLFIGTSDSVFFHRLGGITKVIEKNPFLFGDETATASAGIELAAQFRRQPDYRFAFSIAANDLEGKMLKLLDANDEYGTDGKTVRERLAEVVADVAKQEHQIQQFRSSLMSDTADPVLKRQFFVWMCTDGDQVAFQWLANRENAKAAGK